MSGTTVFTPQDSGLASFTFRRRPDDLDQGDIDAGNRSVITSGKVAHVLEKQPRTRRRIWRFSMVTREHRDALEAYVRDVLDYSTEQFDVQYEDTVNLLTETRRLDLVNPDGPWFYAGQASPATVAPVVTRGEPDRFGGNLATRIAFLGGASGDAQRVGNRLTVAAASGVQYSPGVWIKLVDGPSQTNAIQLDLGTTSELISTFHTPTDDWTFIAGTAQAFGAGVGEDLIFRVKRADGGNQPASDFAVAVHQPQVQVGQVTADQLQAVEQSVHLRRAHLDGPLRWRSRHDGLWDLELALLATSAT